MRYPVPFGRHLLLERVNVGGMAEVFKAKSFGVEGFERIVAVKRILPAMAEDQEFVTMFVDEARIASHLTHQNIVQIYELGRHEDAYFISMEYVGGRDLRQILDLHKRQKKPMDVAKACFIATRVCEALEYAHTKKDPAGKDLKIIHRDVSPQNVIISFEGEVKLCDFGIAKAASRVSRTQVGVLKGKFAYMSPEQVRGQPTDRRSDLFALGVIFYEMLTGERLFLGESDYSTLDAVRAARVPPPTQFNAKIPPQLEQIMLKLLAREPKDRYQWAFEAHEDLLDHLVQDGKIYHARNLRTWMQEVYARDIEVENAKLEEFMKLKHPRLRGSTRQGPAPAPTVVVAGDERLSYHREASIETHVDTTTPSDDLPSPLAEAEAKRPRGRNEDTNTDAHLPPQAELGEGRNRSNQGESPVPDASATNSPVSSIFGAPFLAERSSEQEEAIVRMVRSSESLEAAKPGIEHGKSAEHTQPPPIERIEEGDLERTQFDALGDGNDTLFENPEMTEEEGRRQIKESARAALSHLGQASSKELRAPLDGETLDSADRSGETVSPFVPDPSEASGMGVSALGESPPVESIQQADKTALEAAPDLTPADMLLLAPLEPRGLAAGDGPVPEDFDSDGHTIEGSLEAAPDGEVEASPWDARRSMSERPGGDEKPGRSPSRRLEKRGNGEGPVLGPAGGALARANTAVPRRRIWEVRSEGSRSEATFGDENSTGSAHVAPAPLLKPSTGEEARSLLASGMGGSLSSNSARTLALALRDSRVIVGSVATLVVLVIVFLITILMPGRPEGASLHIVTEPVKQVEVRIDGQLIGRETPVEATPIAIGSHKVELRAVGFQAYTQVITIQEAKPHTMVVPLERIEQPHAGRRDGAGE